MVQGYVDLPEGMYIEFFQEMIATHDCPIFLNVLNMALQNSRNINRFHRFTM